MDRSTTVAPTAFSGTGSLLPPHGLVPTRSGRPVRAKRRARRAAALLALPERCTTGQDARQPRHVQSSRMLLHGGRIRPACSPAVSGQPNRRPTIAGRSHNHRVRSDGFLNLTSAGAPPRCWHSHTVWPDVVASTRRLQRSCGVSTGAVRAGACALCLPRGIGTAWLPRVTPLNLCAKRQTAAQESVCAKICRHREN